MLEIAIAVGTVGLFAAVVLVVGHIQLITLIGASLWMIVIGMAVGLPAGAGYHVAMHRGLSDSGVSAPGWWWSPVRYHAQLDRASYRRVFPWFVAGVAGAGLALTGCGLILLCYFRLPS